MKIHEVSTNYITGKIEVRRQQNLTSFGTSQPTPTEQPKGDDKKANEAIKSNFLANISFSGHPAYVEGSGHRYKQGTSGGISVTLHHKEQLPEKYITHENSASIREGNKYYKVYYADKHENIPSSYYDEFDFIIQDDTPDPSPYSNSEIVSNIKKYIQELKEKIKDHETRIKEVELLNKKHKEFIAKYKNNPYYADEIREKKEIIEKNELGICQLNYYIDAIKTSYLPRARADLKKYQNE